MFAVWLVTYSFSGAPLGADSGTVFLSLYEKVKKHSSLFLSSVSEDE
jgi:hypothetical protein